jgi:anaphase-promoting complex subunit 4
MATVISLLSEVDFDHRAPDGFPAACPTLDLTVTWETGGKHLLILRPPGQIVSKIHQLGQPGQKAPDVLTVRWKPEGEPCHLHEPARP